MATEDPILELITSAIPVDPDDGTTIVGAQVHGGNPYATWGHPITVAALIRDKLTESGRLLPPGGEVKAEWVMRWRHPSSSRLDQTPNFGSERRARQAALSCAKYGGVDVSVHRRDVHVWSDGTHLIGPWSPVVSDSSEVPSA